MIVRHKLLADLVKLWKNDELVEKIDRLPIELSPRKSKPLGRCCVHKERAVWRYKTFSSDGTGYDRRTRRSYPRFPNMRDWH